MLPTGTTAAALEGFAESSFWKILRPGKTVPDPLQESGLNAPTDSTSGQATTIHRNFQLSLTVPPLHSIVPEAVYDSIQEETYLGRWKQKDP